MTPEQTERMMQLAQLLGLLAAGVALAFGGFEALASTLLGGALALVVPNAPKSAALAAGTVAGALALIIG